MSTSGYGHCETYEVPCREGQHREFYWLEALTSCRSGGGAKSQDVEKEMCVHLGNRLYGAKWPSSCSLDYAL